MEIGKRVPGIEPALCRLRDLRLYRSLHEEVSGPLAVLHCFLDTLLFTSGFRLRHRFPPNIESNSSHLSFVLDLLSLTSVSWFVADVFASSPPPS